VIERGGGQGLVRVDEQHPVTAIGEAVIDLAGSGVAAWALARRGA
jgi:predicted nicotinamide N-methyase